MKWFHNSKLWLFHVPLLPPLKLKKFVGLKNPQVVSNLVCQGGQESQSSCLFYHFRMKVGSMSVLTDWPKVFIALFCYMLKCRFFTTSFILLEVAWSLITAMFAKCCFVFSTEFCSIKCLKGILSPLNTLFFKLKRPRWFLEYITFQIVKR